MSGWTGPAADLEIEALRVLPALAAARIRGSVGDAALLLDGYRDDARRLGVPPDTAWLIFATAAVKFFTRLLHVQAATECVDVDEIAARAIAMAADWVHTGEH